MTEKLTELTNSLSKLTPNETDYYRSITFPVGQAVPAPAPTGVTGCIPACQRTAWLKNPVIPERFKNEQQVISLAELAEHYNLDWNLYNLAKILPTDVLLRTKHQFAWPFNYEEITVRFSKQQILEHPELTWNFDQVVVKLSVTELAQLYPRGQLKTGTIYLFAGPKTIQAFEIDDSLYINDSEPMQVLCNQQGEWFLQPREEDDDYSSCEEDEEPTDVYKIFWADQ